MEPHPKDNPLLALLRCLCPPRQAPDGVPYKALTKGCEQLVSLCRAFLGEARARRQPGTPSLDGPAFSRLFALSASPYLVHRLLALWDRDGNGEVDFRELVVGLASLSGVSASANRLKLAFLLLDADNDGFVGRNDLAAASAGVAPPTKRAGSPKRTASPSRSGSPSRGRSKAKPAKNAVPSHALPGPFEGVLREMDLLKLQGLSYGAFCKLAARTPALLAPVEPIWRALAPYAPVAADRIRALRLSGLQLPVIADSPAVSMRATLSAQSVNGLFGGSTPAHVRNGLATSRSLSPAKRPPPAALAPPSQPRRASLEMLGRPESRSDDHRVDSLALSEAFSAALSARSISPVRRPRYPDSDTASVASSGLESHVMLGPTPVDYYIHAGRVAAERQRARSISPAKQVRQAAW